jgi:hypothetical protein
MKSKRDSKRRGVRTGTKGGKTNKSSYATEKENKKTHPSTRWNKRKVGFKGAASRISCIPKRSISVTPSRCTLNPFKRSLDQRSRRLSIKLRATVPRPLFAPYSYSSKCNQYPRRAGRRTT